MPGSARGATSWLPFQSRCLREKLFLRVHSLIPGNLLAGISRHAAHHRQQRAGGHALAVVHRLILADGGEQQVVFALIHVVLLPGPSPVRLAFDARNGTAADGAGAIGAQNVVGVLVVAAFNLAVGEKRAHAVRDRGSSPRSDRRYCRLRPESRVRRRRRSSPAARRSWPRRSCRRCARPVRQCCRRKARQSCTSCGSATPTSLIPAGRSLAGGIGFTGLV